MAEAWTIDINGDTFNVTDYGAQFGLKVERRGYTVLTGYFQGSTVVVDSAQLPTKTLFALTDAIPLTHPKRKQKTLFAGEGKAEAIHGSKTAPKPAARAPIQQGLFGGAFEQATAPSKAAPAKGRGGGADWGPLFAAAEKGRK